LVTFAAVYTQAVHFDEALATPVGARVAAAAAATPVTAVITRIFFLLFFATGMTEFSLM